MRFVGVKPNKEAQNPKREAQNPLYGNNKKTSDGVKKSEALATKFNLRLLSATKQEWVEALKDDISRLFTKDAVGQARVMAAILWMIKKDDRAETGSEADKGYLARKLAMAKNGAARMIRRARKVDGPRKGDGARDKMWRDMQTKKDIDSFRPELRTARVRKAVVALLQDSGKRREATIEAACQKLDLMEEKLNGQLPLADVDAAMKGGLKVAFPQLTDAERAAKVAEVMKTADVDSCLNFALKDAFRKLLERDYILENVASDFYPDRVDGDPLVVKPLIIKEVFKVLNEKIEGLPPVTSKDAWDDTKMTAEHQQILREEVLNEPDIKEAIIRSVKEELAKTLAGLIAATAGQPDDTPLTEPYGAEALNRALLDELVQLRSESDQKDLFDKLTEKSSLQIGKEMATLTVGDLRQVGKDFENLKKALEEPLPAPELDATPLPPWRTGSL